MKIIFILSESAISHSLTHSVRKPHSPRIPMLHRRSLLPLTLVCALAACADEDTTPSDAADTGHVDLDVEHDMGHADVGTDATADTGATDAAEDAAADAALDAAADTNADTGADTNADTNADTGETCDPAIAAAEALAPVDAVSEGTVTATADGDGWTLEIDASAGGTVGAAENPYVYVDIVSGQAVAITDLQALESYDWVLGFKRSVIRTNSGDSGPSTYMVARVEGSNFDAAEAPGPDGVWNRDDFIDPDDCSVITEGRDTPLTAFSIWYDYDPETHAVTPTEDVVYFIYEPTSHAAYKLAITGWESGVYTIRVAPL